MQKLLPPLVATLAGVFVACSVIYRGDDLLGGPASLGDSGVSVDTRNDSAVETDSGGGGSFAPFCFGAPTTCTGGAQHCCHFGVGDHLLCADADCPKTEPTTSEPLFFDGPCFTTHDCLGTGEADPVCCVIQDFPDSSEPFKSRCGSSSCDSRWRLCERHHDEECKVGEKCCAETKYLGTVVTHGFGHCEALDYPCVK